MGKDLKGKNLGKCLYQKKDKRYYARFTTRSGTRKEKGFATLPEARNWLADQQYADQHPEIVNPYIPSEMTVDMWFDYWIHNIVNNLAPNTRRNYWERYENNVKPVLGGMRLTDVKPMHCKMVLNQMEPKYAGSTILQTFITMGTMFRSAVSNDLIQKHPMNGVRFTKPLRAPNDIKFLSVQDEEKFLSAAKTTHNYAVYAFILETGLRTGELIGLTWDDIDWAARTLTIRRSMEYRHCNKEWCAGPTKSMHSYRTIPLTNCAYQILKDVEATRDIRKQSEALSQKLTYLDRRTGQTVEFPMSQLVFLNWRTGEPTKNSSYDTELYKIADKAGIHRFCMHALRHTYATRAIESGVPPEVLQRLLGHSSIKTTMDRYVHVTTDTMENAVRLFEKRQNRLV